MSHKQMLVEDAETCRRKMTNAMALIEGLGGEKVSSILPEKLRLVIEIDQLDNRFYYFTNEFAASRFAGKRLARNSKIRLIAWWATSS